MPIFEQTDFDSCLYLLGGREQSPPNALRVADGISGVHSKSIKSRDGIAPLYDSAFPPFVTAIGVYSFAGHRYAVTSNGHIYKDGTLLYSGSTYNGNGVSFSKAPPNFGSAAYLFVAGINPPVKISAAGVVTNWGIAQPTTAMSAALITQGVIIAIDPLDSTTVGDWTTLGSATLAATGPDSPPNSDACFQVTIAPHANGGIVTTSTPTLPLDLTAGGAASDFDAVTFQVQIDQPDNLKGIHLAFDYNSNGFKTDYYYFQLPVSDLVVPNIAATANDIASLDALAGQILGKPTNVAAIVGENQLSTEYVKNLKQYLLTYQHNHIGQPFKPSLSAQNLLINSVLNVTSGNDNWWFVQIPRRFFVHFGATQTNQWSDITGIRFRFLNMHSSVAVNILLADLAFVGGTGMFGTYQYLVSYSNASGHYSQPNSASAITPPDPTTIANVQRQGVALSGIPTSGDSQVTGRIIWRTVGNGGLYYAVPNPNATTSGSTPQLPTIPDNTTTTFNDTASDFFGYGPSDTDVNVLTSIPLVPLQVLPTTTISSIIYFNGTLFACGDTATGSKGRFYYSALGYGEGVANYTDISNDDDPTKGFAIFGGYLFLLTTKACWQVSDISQGPLIPLFTANPIVGAPGCLDAASIATTANAVVYRSADGLYGMNGYGSFAVAAQILPLFRGQTVESYAPVGTIVASTYGRDEYIFSDNSTNTYAVNVAARSLVNVNSPNDLVRSIGVPLSALYFEPESGDIQCGDALRRWGLLEQPLQLNDAGVAIPFNVRPASIYASIKYQTEVQRIFIDANLNGNTLTAYFSVDGNDILLGLISGATRKVFEFDCHATGRLLGVYLTGSTNVGIVEVFRIAIEGEPYGTGTGQNAPT